MLENAEKEANKNRYSQSKDSWRLCKEVLWVMGKLRVNNNEDDWI
jgi:hypothetical protein